MRQQALGNHTAQRIGQLKAHLILLVRRKDVDNAINRLHGIDCVNGGKHKVSGLRSRESGAHRFQIAHFA